MQLRNRKPANNGEAFSDKIGHNGGDIIDKMRSMMNDDTEDEYGRPPVNTPLLADCTSDTDPSPTTPDTETGPEPKEDTVMVDTNSKLGLFTLAGFIIVIFQVTCEVGKQISNYSIQYYNGGKYPLPQTLLVILVELIKLLTTIGRSKCELPSFSRDSLRRSLRFLLPAVLYALNNNIYYAGLILVPPPIWLILCSFRTVISASVYKFVLKRNISHLQFTGALCIVVSIVIAKMGDLMSDSTTNTVPMIAVVLAVIASCNSVGAAVYTESLFKAGASTGEKFLDQQFWLYLYAMLVASMVHIISATNINSIEAFISLSSVIPTVQILLVAALLFGSIGGLVVAAILKQLDNIVKEYSAATANMITALICSFLFPEKFEFTLFILLSMVLLFIGIFLYETAKPKQSSSVLTSVSSSSTSSKFDNASKPPEKA